MVVLTSPQTIQTLAVLSYLSLEKNLFPHLIVVPSTTLQNWEREITKWAPKVCYALYFLDLN